jgi:hypothetical protein
MGANSPFLCDAEPGGLPRFARWDRGGLEGPVRSHTRVAQPPSVVFGGRAALQRREKMNREAPSLRRRPSRSVTERP